jgi:hypothetical protein
LQNSNHYLQNSNRYLQNSNHYLLNTAAAVAGPTAPPLQLVGANKETQLDKETPRHFGG